MLPELVSRLMGHRDIRITQQVYARVREETSATACSMRSPCITRPAQRHARGHVEPVPTLTALPSPKSGAVLYDVNGTRRTLTEWARARGIAKTTLHHRVVKKGLSMAAAIALGSGGQGRPLAATSGNGVTRSNCRTGAADAVKTAALMARPDGVAASLAPRVPAEISVKMVGAAGFESTTLRPPGDTASEESPNSRQNDDRGADSVARDPAPRGTGVASDAVEEALVVAFEDARRRCNWKKVAELAKALEAHRAPRLSADVVDLDGERRRRSR